MNEPIINRLNSVKACITVANLTVHLLVWNGHLRVGIPFLQ